MRVQLARLLPWAALLYLFAEHVQTAAIYADSRTHPYRPGIPDLSLEDPSAGSHLLNNGTLLRRADDYDVAKEKGFQRKCQLDRGQSPGSEWNNFNNLAATGWVLLDEGDSTEAKEEDVDDAFKDALKGDWPTTQKFYQVWEHENEVVYKGVTYRKSKGSYESLFSPLGGLIVAVNNHSPKDQAPEGQLLPKLQKWSDVIYLAWEKLCAENNVFVGDLKRVFRFTISNDDTMPIIIRAVQDAGKSLSSTWDDKVVFRPGEDGFNAILGTVHGSGVAWLLIQHRKQMGHLTVNAINYFETSEGEPSLEIEIGPYEP